MKIMIFLERIFHFAKISDVEVIYNPNQNAKRGRENWLKVFLYGVWPIDLYFIVFKHENIVIFCELAESYFLENRLQIVTLEGNRHLFPQFRQTSIIFKTPCKHTCF